MMFEKEDLGLSLSLSCTSGSAASSAVVHGGLPRNHHLLQHPSPLQLNLLGAASSSSSSSLPAANLPFASAANLKASWLDSFPSSDRTSEAPCRVVGSTGSGAGAGAGPIDPRSFLRGIDVNRTPANVAEDDEAGVSSPNSTISSVSGKRCQREVTAGGAEVSAGDDLDLSRGISDEEDGDNSRKKLRLSKDQSNVLEESFKEHNTLNPKQKLALAKRLGLRPRQVEVWFQNRRARTKLKQTEVDCEFLKRCCEQLTEDNRRLQKEVQELRTLKLSPQFYMQMTPPTTLTMCPSCERVSAPPSSASVSVDARPGQGSHNRGLLLNPWGVAAPVPVRPFGK